MNKDFFTALDMLEQEKGIPKDYMVEKVEAALASACKKDFGVGDNVVVHLNEKRYDFKVCLKKTVVEVIEDPQIEITLEDARKKSEKYELGDIVEVEIQTKDFGRIAAQTAKQVIIQGIREAEKIPLYNELSSKNQELITGVVQRVDQLNGNALIEVGGKTELMLLSREQIPGESIQVGDTIKVFVSDVKKGVKGPSVNISRVHPGFVKRLFEMNVPEIYEGVVEIKSIAREAGLRTKIAVWSKDENVDAVGSCIGPKSTRVTAILNEMKGEKIDIIKYSEDMSEFVKAALSPSEVIKVDIDEEERICFVEVPESQLSLAIGKEGQNARLAAKLTGMKIDIKPISEK